MQLNNNLPDRMHFRSNCRNYMSLCRNCRHTFRQASLSCHRHVIISEGRSHKKARHNKVFVFVLQICSANRKSEDLRIEYFFRLADLPQMCHFRVCDLRINHYKFADLRFVDLEICGLAIAEWTQELTDSRLRTNKKEFAPVEFEL
jgi:hypothetical protein